MVDDVDDAVLVEVPFARVPDSVPFQNNRSVSVLRRLAARWHARTHRGDGETLTVRVLLVHVDHQPAVVVLVQDAVVVVVIVALVSL